MVFYYIFLSEKDKTKYKYCLKNILRDRRITSKKAKIEELQTGIVSKWQLSTDKRRERKSRISKKLFRNYKKLGIHLLV